MSRSSLRLHVFFRREGCARSDSPSCLASCGGQRDSFGRGHGSSVSDGRLLTNAVGANEEALEEARVAERSVGTAREEDVLLRVGNAFEERAATLTSRGVAQAEAAIEPRRTSVASALVARGSLLAGHALRSRRSTLSGGLVHDAVGAGAAAVRAALSRAISTGADAVGAGLAGKAGLANARV